jgi:hypothetical protein
VNAEQSLQAQSDMSVGACFVDCGIIGSSCACGAGQLLNGALFADPQIKCVMQNLRAA